MNLESNNTIVKTDDGWYFLDEIGDGGGGPYENEYIASAQQILYCLTELGGYSPEHEQELIDKYVKMWTLGFEKQHTNLIKKPTEERDNKE